MALNNIQHNESVFLLLLLHVVPRSGGSSTGSTLLPPSPTHVPDLTEDQTLRNLYSGPAEQQLIL